ncbi:PIG-P-domain-containing protein [Tirmania nivea]|nr:PIG-P-domain-containing protein [Tirmania nivea]
MSSSPETTRFRGSRGSNSCTSTNNQSQPLEPSSDSEYDSSSSSSSLTASNQLSSLLQPTSLYPPFYNRPPTPLPPSPSLTSLLLPHRTSSVHTLSAPPSPRHTPLHSPDHSPSASDTESTPHGARAAASAASTGSTTTSSAVPLTTDSSLAFSSHFASQTPRASPRVPTYEYYGFVLYLISTVSFLMYILWSYLPAPMLHAIGIHYYPSRWWSLALPSWLVVAVGWIYVALAGYNTGYLTPNLNAVEGVVDGVAKIAVVNFERERERGGENGKGKEREKDWKKLWNKGTDGVIDIPIGGICEVLYGEQRELEEWEVYGLDSSSGYDAQYDGEEGGTLIRNAGTGGDGLGILAGDGNGHHHQDEREEWAKFRGQMNLPQSPRESVDGVGEHSWGRNGNVSESGGAGGEGREGGRKSKKRGSGGGGGKQQGRR